MESCSIGVMEHWGFDGEELDPSIVIPADAGIQVCSAEISLDTRFRGYDEANACSF